MFKDTLKTKKNSYIHFGLNDNNIKKHKKNPVLLKDTEDIKHKNNTSNSDNSDDDSDDENPFKFPNLFKEEQSKIYLKHNHLYFHNAVTEKSVDNVKKLMREYHEKCKKIKNQSTISTFIPKPLYIHIFSPGGDIHSGFALYDFIIEYTKIIPVYTVVEGVAASAATIISIAGEKRYITPNSYMLIHQISTYFGGNYEQIQDEFGNCEKIMKQLKEIYAKKTKLSKKQLSDILKRDINWNANDCVKYGLVDEIKLVDVFNDGDF